MDGSNWIVRIRNNLNEILEEDDDDISATITSVPKPLMLVKPEAYIPQLIALGPYHHSREELHQMERCKLSAAKKIKIRLQDVRFEHVVDMFYKDEYRIRAHYHRYIPFNGEILAWMMAIDASFLIEFLQTYSISGSHNHLKIPSQLVNSSTRRTSTHDMLIRDIIMLENQVPLFLLLKILRLQVASPKLAEENLTLLLISFINELTPFKNAANFQSIEITHHSHLLELLYHSIITSDHEEPLDQNEVTDLEDRGHKFYGFLKNFAVIAKEFVLSRIKALIKLPWIIITSIPPFAILKPQVDNFFNFQPDQNANLNHTQVSSQGISFDEITIPSVSELVNIGIQFEPTHGDISGISFSAKTAILQLPVINLDVNSEVVLRNLVACEVAIITGPLAFTRYIEFMNGIIDTAEDAKLLREKRVLVNRLRSDDEVAELWNGMSRSVRLTKVRVLDEVIEEVNKYYNGRWKVKIGRCMRKYVVCSWESLVAVLVLLLFLLVGLQSFSIGFGLLFRSWGHMRGKP